MLDTLENGHAAAVGTSKLIIEDAGDRNAVTRALLDHSVDVVVHFAAYKSAPESVVDPGRYFDNNTTATLRLIEAMLDVGVKLFVFSSTCAVYGEPKILPVNERARTLPLNPYGESKLMVERMLPWFESVGLRWVSLRYFNAAGATFDGSLGEDWERAASLIPITLRVAAGGSPALDVYGTDYQTSDGTAIRDYVHVEDLATAHAAAIDYLSAGRRSAVINLGTGRGHTVMEVVETARAVTGRAVRTVSKPRRPGDPAAMWADATLASRLLGWRAEHGLRAIVESAWRWHALHPQGHREPPHRRSAHGHVNKTR